MKILTITCHDCYNFGASLQAFALQSYLESIGHNVRIIDYKPEYLSRHYKLSIIANPIYDKPILRQLYLIAKLPERLLALRQKKVFDTFTAKYLQLTNRYNSYEELKADAPDADIYIAGSDQIWNTLLNNGRDPAFYLDFGKASTKRISYAASFATKEIAKGCEEFVRQELKNLDAISIREKISLPLLRSLGRVDGVSVCDPVFLLSREQWKHIASDDKKTRVNRDYLLVYLTDRSKVLLDIASAIHECTGLEVFTIGVAPETMAYHHIRNIGPLDFINLVSNASFVISNSFHATAFSMIFEKNFCVVNRKEEINERMKSILEEFGLSNRIVSEFDSKLLQEIDYSKITPQIVKKANESKAWLNNEINKTY